ncbi:MAG TPA: THUMP domain-containing protein [Burkholderiaceae bacterium]|nr:THUMP domain-containing protein [Burkholderiaceae bacterium]
MIAALFLPCAQGVEPLLVDELQRLPGLASARVELRHGGALVNAPRADDVPLMAMHCNLESRLAQRVLWPLAHGGYRSEHDVYSLARSVAWRDWITPRETLRVDVTSVRSPLKSLHFAALRVKDAIVDTLRETTGERPGVDTRQPDLPLVLHLSADEATLYVDTSGEALFKRGWRDDKGEAPLKETLAAAMLAAAGWQGRDEDGPLLDPVCGSGTIAIEAAQLACGIAPGLNRRFSFERMAPFRGLAMQWRQLKQAAQARVHAPATQIFGGDVSFRMTDFATRNAERAGVRGAIEFKTADALQRLPPAPAGTLMLNPPYGERIAPKGRRSSASPSAPRMARESFEQGDPNDFFSQLASHWKRHYAGWTAWVLSPDPKLPSAMRLKESRRVPLWNGPIECRLFRFDVVEGSLRRGSMDAT